MIVLSHREVPLTSDKFRCSFEQSTLKQDTDLSKTTFKQSNKKLSKKVK